MQLQNDKLNYNQLQTYKLIKLALKLHVNAKHELMNQLRLKKNGKF